VPLTETFEISIDDYLTPNGGIISPIRMRPPAGRLRCRDRAPAALECRVGSGGRRGLRGFGAESAVGLVDATRNCSSCKRYRNRARSPGCASDTRSGRRAIEACHRVKDSFNSYPAGPLRPAGAAAAIDDRAHFEQICTKVIATRTRLVSDLASLGFDVLPSAANLYLRGTVSMCTELAARLRERSIIVRHFENPPRIAPFLRITSTDVQAKL